VSQTADALIEEPVDFFDPANRATYLGPQPAMTS
jgi:hypothetical protein